MDRQEQSSGPGRGRLKVFLGAAAGVGKTYAMLGEARDLTAAGVDVVVGYLEAHQRRATEDRAAGLEVAPRRVVRVASRSSAWWTSWPTPTTREAATPSAGRTWRSCWAPASTSSPPSTSSTWRASTTRSSS